MDAVLAGTADLGAPPGVLPGRLVLAGILALPAPFLLCAAWHVRTNDPERRFAVPLFPLGAFLLPF
jgi:hypothetical protein